MKSTVAMNVLNMSLNVNQLENVCWEPGSVMVMLTVLMAVMKLMMFVTTENAMRRQSSSVTMANVFQLCGDVTLMMIAAMTVMNLLIFVEIRTVQLAGEDVHPIPTTGVFQNGCSVMERTTVETELMNWLKTVLNAKTRETSNAETIDVFLSAGLVTLKMTVEIIQMRVKIYALENTENVQNQNSNVAMINVFLQDGSVIMMMIVVMVVMKAAAKITNVLKIGLNVTLDIV
jgi:hypothetical protein